LVWAIVLIVSRGVTAGLLPIPHAVRGIAWLASHRLVLSLPPRLRCNGLDGRLIATPVFAPATFLSWLTLATLTATAAFGARLVVAPALAAVPILPRLILPGLILPGLILALLLDFPNRCGNCLCRLIAATRTAAEAGTPRRVV
jgi:hypothetical protein